MDPPCTPVPEQPPKSPSWPRSQLGTYCYGPEHSSAVAPPSPAEPVLVHLPRSHGHSPKMPHLLAVNLNSGPLRGPPALSQLLQTQPSHCPTPHSLYTNETVMPNNAHI